jgi:subtilisin family serine protease
VEGSVTEPDSWKHGLEPTIADQVDNIKSTYLAAGIKIGVVTRNGGVDYMYAEDQLLVRDRYLGRVREILREILRRDDGHDPERNGPGRKPDGPGRKPDGPDAGPERHDREPDGPNREPDRPGHEGPGHEGPGRVRRIIGDVVLLDLGETHLDLPAALSEIDQRLGEGIATPNHVLTVAGGVMGPCPATEPEEVYEGIEPYPSACPGGGGAGVLIYMSDTGLLADTTSHPWLAGVTGEPDPNQPVVVSGTLTIKPYAGHGTFVAGVARCMAPGADVIVSNAFKIAGSALETYFVEDLKGALDYGVDIFHLAVTAPTRKDLYLLAFGAWLRRLRQYKGVVCVAAAGNNGSRLPCWPGGFPEMVSVGALAGDWRSRASFSNFGGWVDVYAPGRDLVNAFATGTYTCYDHPYEGQKRKFYGMCKWSGTSFSTPVVTGLIAARMSRTGENGQEAAAALLAEARSHAIPGVGAILLPGCHDRPDGPAGCSCHSGMQHPGCEPGPYSPRPH